jgi:hypothetical protein
MRELMPRGRNVTAVFAGADESAPRGMRALPGNVPAAETIPPRRFIIRESTCAPPREPLVRRHTMR